MQIPLLDAGTLACMLKRMLQRWNAREQKGYSERVFAAAFGKHPRWDDHIDDIGLDTDVLVAVKRLLYVEGIGGNTDAGSWKKLEREQVIETFRHVFVWVMGGDTVVGCLWPSRDGKGRTSYPMIVCAQCLGLPLLWVVNAVLPRLEKTEAACASSTSAPEVRRIIQNAQSECRQLARQCEPVRDPQLATADALARLAELPELGPDRQGLHRILYHLDREAVQSLPSSGKRQGLRPTSVRVPASSPASREECLMWIRFLLTRFGSNTPILAVMPSGHPWLDLIIGEPTSIQLFCLRASLGAIPFTSSIPYGMDPDFVTRTNQLIDDSRGGTEGKSAGGRG